MSKILKMLTKTRVQDFLKEIEVEDLVHNIQIMGNDVYIDMTAHSPAMHEKKKAGSSYETGFCIGIWRRNSA